MESNVGINGAKAPIDKLTPEEFDQIVNINFRGTYLTLHYGIPLMKKTGPGITILSLNEKNNVMLTLLGSVVVVSSIQGNRKFSSTGSTAYAATKVIP